MDSSFYLLPKNGVPPSITMFSFKNVTLKKFPPFHQRFLVSHSAVDDWQTVCNISHGHDQAGDSFSFHSPCPLSPFPILLDIQNHALVPSSFSCSRLPALCTGKPRTQTLPHLVYATYPTNTTSKRKLLKTWQWMHNPLPSSQVPTLRYSCTTLVSNYHVS
jgi:hypothetical protein